MSLSLYEITEGIAALQELASVGDRADAEAAEAEVGELLDRYLDRLLPEKVDGYCRMIHSLKAAATVKRDEAKRLTDRARAHENTAGRMVDRLKAAMITVDRKAIDTDLFRVTVQASPASVVITDEAAIPDAFHVAKVSINKSALKAALKAGDTVPGATLAAANSHLRIK